jgi:hypothetical protein
MNMPTVSLYVNLLVALHLMILVNNVKLQKGRVVNAPGSL